MEQFRDEKTKTLKQYYRPHQVIGFHSCEKSVGLDVLNGVMDLLPSTNSWDWLGSGIYFWEDNPIRAIQYAEECARGIQKNKTGIRQPFVVGAIIELGNCLNLMEPFSINVIKKSHQSLLKIYAETRKQIPQNNRNIRRLDCAVIKYTHEVNKFDVPNKPPYDTIRCAFPEGAPIYEHSNFTERSHIELCVINPNMIKGYFLPRPLTVYNPYLNKQQ